MLLILMATFVLPGGFAAETESEDAALLEWMRDYVKENYYLEVDDDQLTEGMLKGMLETLDPYSTYLTKEEMTDLFQSLNNSFEGVGMYLIEAKPYIRVHKVIPDSPAEKAGILADDLIVSVDGESIHGQSLEVVVAKIKGPAGTEVKVGIQRPGKTGELSFTLTRQRITIESVTSKVIDGSVGYIKLEDFGFGVEDKFRKAVSSFRNRGINDIVVDLRGNPGGYLDAAVDIADTLLPIGSKIVTVDYRREADDTEYAKRMGFEGDIAVLIDGKSASASEVLTAALIGRENVRVFGETSYGKGLVQEVRRLSTGDGVKLTIAEYYGPSGLKIQGVGITPDEEVVDSGNDLSPFKALAPFYFTEPLKVGEASVSAFALQQRLKLLGYEVQLTGVFDQGTQQALSHYEKASNYPIDGILDEIVKKSIDRAIFERYNQVVADEPLQKSLEWLKIQ
jgi:carboxyl-terminal processing protease